LKGLHSKQTVTQPTNTTDYFYLNAATCFGLKRPTSGHHC